jgi:hypothetical protein
VPPFGLRVAAAAAVLDGAVVDRVVVDRAVVGPVVVGRVVVGREAVGRVVLDRGALACGDTDWAMAGGVGAAVRTGVDGNTVVPGPVAVQPTRRVSAATATEPVQRRNARRGLIAER